MNRKEVPRAGLVKLALAGQITNQQGAAGSRLTVRQFQRVKARVRAEGLRGVLHRRRGQPSPRALPSGLRAQVAARLQSVYRDVNDCHATEKLREVEGLPVSWPWARLLQRGFGFEVLVCDRCGGRRRILDAVTEPHAVRRLLAALGLAAEPPPDPGRAA